VTADSAVTVIDYHAHTEASHDGRHGWTALDLAGWHAIQGFGASYVTDHNRVFDGLVDDPITLLPGAEWSVYRQHILALGQNSPVDRDPYNRDTPSMLGLFAELHRRGAIAIASIPEYWRSHWEDLDDFVKAGVDGFEIVNCAPKAIGFPAQARARVVALARRHNLLLTGGSDNHGWGKVTCVWNLASPSAHGFKANRVLARPVALVQGEWRPWTAAYTQPWLVLRSLTWPERASWLTWLLVMLIYRAVPRRDGDPGGIGILARSLSLKILRLRRPGGTL
jgi:predicted metal-dependent phosphoesterase TrpH